MQRRSHFVLAALMICLTCSAAFGQISFTQRTTYYSFGIPDPNTFAGTSGFYDNYINLQATNIGDSEQTVWTALTLAQGFNWQTLDGNFTVSYTGGPAYKGTLTAVNGLTDTMEISYGFPLGPDFSQSFITRGVSGGYNVLNFSGGGSNGLNNGFAYYLTLTIPGDWSTQGTAQGDHNFISLNPAWSTTTNFAFNGTNTIFQAQELNYQGDNPGLQFQLYGAPVPEPSSLVLLGSGLLALAGTAKRRLLG